MSSTDTGDSALAIVRAEAAQIRRSNIVTRALTTAYLLAMIAAVILFKPLGRGDGTSVYWLAAICSGMLVLIVLHHAQRDAAKSIASRIDGNAIPGLSEALHSTDRDTCRLVQTALAPLLYRVTANDAVFFDERTRANLRATLSIFASDWKGLVNWSYTEGFAIAILRAFEQVGDPESVPTAEALANSRYTRLSQAAREALPGLRQRSEELRQSQTLLRPSDQGGDESKVLVRPAAGIGDASETLLRVGVGAPGDGDA